MTKVNFNRSKKFKKIFKAIYAILTAAVFISLLVCLYLSHVKKTVPAAASEPEPEIPVNSEPIEPAYITETCYDGDQEVNPRLYHYPFQKTEFYLKNKDLVQKAEPEVIEQLQTDANSFVQNYFQFDSSSFSRNYEMECLEFRKLFLPESEYFDIKGNCLNTEQYIDDLIRTLVNSDLQSEATFETDKSLVWRDNTYYVRGYLTIKVFKCASDEELAAYYPFNFKGNSTIYAVVDIGLIPDVGNYRLTSIDYIWQEQED